MRRRAAALALALLIGGCGQKERQPRAPIDSEQLNAIASSGPTVAETLAKGNDTLPARPKPEAFDYQGRWAPTPALCRSRPWRFARAAVTVVGESRCTAPRADPRTASEVKLTLVCTATGPRAERLATQEVWSLVRRDDGSMIVARTAGNGVPETTTLRRCR